MEHDECAEFLGLLPERGKGRIGQFLAGDIGEEFNALELERPHAALELFRSLGAVRHRHGAERDEAVGLLRDVFRKPVVHHAARRHGDVERHRVIALRRRRHDELHVDAHLVEIGEALVVAGHARADIVFLMLLQRLGLGGREMRKRDRRPIEVRICVLRRPRHSDMGMDVNGHALRPHLAAGAAALACRGGDVFVPHVRHQNTPRCCDTIASSSFT